MLGDFLIRNVHNREWVVGKRPDLGESQKHMLSWSPPEFGENANFDHARSKYLDGRLVLSRLAEGKDGGSLQKQATEWREDDDCDTGVKVPPGAPFIAAMPEHEAEIGNCGCVMGVFEQLVEAIGEVWDREEDEKDEDAEGRSASELDKSVSD
jgi:hypothetical protein